MLFARWCLQIWLILNLNLIGILVISSRRSWGTIISYRSLFAVIVTQECSHCKVLWWLRSNIWVHHTTTTTILYFTGVYYRWLLLGWLSPQMINKSSITTIRTRSYLFIAFFTPHSLHRVSTWVLGCHCSGFFPGLIIYLKVWLWLCNLITWTFWMTSLS